MPDAETPMARLQRLCRALALPEVTEGTSYGQPALKVRDKTFVSLKQAEQMVLQCPLDRKEMLLEMAPEIYWQTDHFRGWPALLVRLEAISDAELSLRLAEAWRHRAPKRLAAAYGA